MNSLKIKILGLTILILGLAVSLTAWHNLRTQNAIIDQIALHNSQILCETIGNSISTNMATGQNAEVAKILEKVKSQPMIESVRIFDETGRILISASSEEIGDLIAAADLLSYRAGKYSLYTTSGGHQVHTAMLPIHNAPNCYGCHDPEKQVLGILTLHTSLSELQAVEQKGREAVLLSSVGMLVILIIVITGFILYYVDTPIRRLMAAMDHVEAGEFDQAATRIQSSEEMSLLAAKFNRMVKRLKDLMERTVQHEREMAITQEKLAHHEEIRNMNSTLEERVKEIEFLNITLEERIEEIEEANYKIADLASDLESKNTTLAQAVARLSALYKMGLAINSIMDLEKLFNLLLRKTMEAIHAKIGYILLLDRDTWTLRIGAAVGIETEKEIQIPLRPGGVSNWVIENNQPLLIQDIDEARQFSRISRLGFTRETVLCAPLVIKDEVIGTISIANRADETPFTNEDLDLLATIAAQASVAIKNARLYEEQQTLYLSTVQALVSTIEANDTYTRGHSERVTRYSLGIARHLGLSPESILTLEQAAILHDIGKIGIETNLLHKEERLSETDIHILRQHPTIGGNILRPIYFLQGVREIIEQHHERFDGSGYPSGLKGEGILFEARILAVADAYDAMTSDRPYRKALADDVAIREILDNAGSQFDPAVTEAFIRMWNSEIASTQKAAEG